ncbi:uncharacterized protein LOC115664633 [Syzygium oleosum]|uniref:uncharacterized protein LOC115664633 n=1 Tax=Syzygium oleosum TaxID=219896 RepID=UPI0024BB7DE3|nr:uncharacterized protein LOC115664633 [Syzygium oleosum]
MQYAEHRMCARHIYANWAKKYKGDQLQRQFWLIAKSTNMTEFRIHKKALHALSAEAFDALFQTEAKHWCKAFFSEEFKCDAVDNNLCEAFNGRIIGARCKSIISMLEDIRILVMTRLQKQRDECANWPTQCGPRIVKKLDDNIPASRFYHPIWNGDDGYEIMHNGDKYVVHLERKNCSCRAWQLTGIPCCHAICAILLKQANPKDYVDDCYKKPKYLAAYQFMMQPLRSSKFWDKTNHPPPEPLPLKKLLGRPKKKRRLQEIEISSNRMSRAGGIIRCSLCHRERHNKVGCPNKKQQQRQEQTTQANDTGVPQGATQSNDGEPSGPTQSNIVQPRSKIQVRKRSSGGVSTDSSAPQRTRGALGKRLRKYGYGLFTDMNTGMTILNRC